MMRIKPFQALWKEAGGDLSPAVPPLPGAKGPFSCPKPGAVPGSGSLRGGGPSLGLRAGFWHIPFGEGGWDLPVAGWAGRLHREAGDEAEAGREGRREAAAPLPPPFGRCPLLCF